MIRTIAELYAFQIQRIHPVEAPNIVSILVRIAAALMVRVDAADGAEVVPGNPRMKLVEAEEFCAPHDTQVRPRQVAHDGAFSSAQRTVAPACVNDPVGKKQFELDGTAVASGAVVFVDDGATDILDH